jgi:hypothetical protein
VQAAFVVSARVCLGGWRRYIVKPLHKKGTQRGWCGWREAVFLTEVDKNPTHLW